jgi:hypothetical protein
MSFTIVSKNQFLQTYHQSNGTGATNQVFNRAGP